MGEQMFGPYRLDGLIGRGGMGEVHRAYDTVRKRFVALKLLPVGLAGDKGFQARFRRESEVAARLREPHVIPIHDFGEIDGQLFIDMRLVDGVDLASVLERDGPLPPARAVHIVGQIAAALDAAHADRLIHRDVKPSNVLISGSGADEFAYLIDFGIARNMLGSATTGATVGTLAYMAPERFLNADGGDTRIDVYALACLLHEVLTGQKPFPGQEPAPLMYAHLNTPPPRPSTVRAGLPRGFDEVVARGMAKDPQDRYPSAGELAAAARAADVGSAPAGRPVSAPGPRDGSTTRVPPRLPPATRPVPETQVRAGPTTPTAASTQVDSTPVAPQRRRSRVGLAVGAVGAIGALAGVIGLLASFINGPADPGPAGGAAASQHSYTDAAVVATITVPDGPWDVAVAPDGARALVVNQGDDSASVIDVHTGQVVGTVTVEDNPLEGAVTQDGTRALVTNFVTDSVSVIDMAAGQVVGTVTVQDSPNGVATSPDGARALVANQGSDSVSVIDVAAGQVVDTIGVQDGPSGVAMMPDGDRALVTNRNSDSVSVIDVAAGQEVATIAVQSSPRAVAVTSDGTRAYVANSGSGSVSVIDIAAGRVVGTVTVQDGPIGIAVTPDGARALVTNQGSDSVSVIDVAAGQVVGTVTVQDGPIGVAVTPDGTRAVVANAESDSVSVIDTGLR